MRVVTALLASLGWRLALAQDQGWHPGEKVSSKNSHFLDTANNEYLANCEGRVKSQPILSPGHKTTGAVRRGAGTSNDDQQANKGGGETLLPPPWRDHRGLVDPPDEGEGPLGGEAEGGWEEVAPAWENP